MSHFLVDTSVWIDFLRGSSAVVARVDPLLAKGQGAICGPIYAEVLSGARTRYIQHRLRNLFQALRWLPEPLHVWDRVAEVRFNLARLGHQASLPDVMIALTAAESVCALLTRDRDFERIRSVLPLDLVVF